MEHCVAPGDLFGRVVQVLVHVDHGPPRCICNTGTCLGHPFRREARVLFDAGHPDA